MRRSGERVTWDLVPEGIEIVWIQHLLAPVIWIIADGCALYRRGGATSHRGRGRGRAGVVPAAGVTGDALVGVGWRCRRGAGEGRRGGGR